MTVDIVALVANAGGTLGLAIFAIWMLNRVWELRLEEARRNATAEREGREAVQEALNRNTDVLRELCLKLERGRDAD